MTTILHSLHSKFCKLTDADEKVLRYCWYESNWYEFHSAGFTEDDLQLVVDHIKAQNRKHRADFKRSLKLSRIVGDLSRFAEDLVEARRLQARKPTAREQALGSLRGFIPARDGRDAVVIADILKARK